MACSHVLAADFGGGHISCAIVELASAATVADTLIDTGIDSKAGRDDILDAWAAALEQSMHRADGVELAGVGFAMPGPFDYRCGTARFAGSDKYESLRGVNIPAHLTPRLKTPLEMRFINDASAFGIGETSDASRLPDKAERVIAVTLGTGFGSAFLEAGVPQTSGSRVPPQGSLWHLPFGDGLFDDYVSVRWLQASCASVRAERVRGVREIAAIARQDPACAAFFQEYGANLGIAIAEWIGRFAAQCLVIGGNIARAFDLFGDALQRVLERHGAAVPIVLSENTAAAAIRGAARLFEDDFWRRVRPDLPSL